MLSLPAIPVAIAFFLIIETLLPFSHDGMCRATALVEQHSVYGIFSDGRQVACFKPSDNGLAIAYMAEPGDSTAATTVVTEGCWINDMPVMPSCRGRILIPDADVRADSIVAAMNGNIARVLQEETCRLRGKLRLLSALSSETGYYLNRHDVRDEGFNNVAEYAGYIKTEKSKAERLIGLLEKAMKEKNTVVRHTSVYTLITSGEGQKVRRMACTETGEEYTHGFITVRTADRKTPPEARAIYINRLVGCTAGNGDHINAAGICGAGTEGFVPGKAPAMISGGHVSKDLEHGMPPLLVPDGSPLFSKNGFFIGISKGGKIVDVRKKKKTSNRRDI